LEDIAVAPEKESYHTAANNAARNHFTTVQKEDGLSEMGT